MAPLGPLLTQVTLFATLIIDAATAQGTPPAATPPDTTPLAKFDYTVNGNCSRFRCLPQPVVAAEFPAYQPGALQNVDAFINYEYTGIAKYTYFVTTDTAFQRPDSETVQGMVNFTSAAYKHGMLPCMVVGGEDGSQFFSDRFKTPEGRNDFAKRMVDYMYNNKFRCAEIFWPSPGTSGTGCDNNDPLDTANLISFFNTWRGFAGAGYNLTLAVPANGFTLADGTKLTNYTALANVVDWFTLLTYEYNTDAWSRKTAPDAPSYDCAASGGIVEGVNRLIEGGVRRDQIMIASPSKGFAFSTSSSNLEQIQTTRSDGTAYIAEVYQKIDGIPEGEDGDTKESPNSCGNKPAAFTGEWHLKTLIAKGYLQKDGRTGGNGYERKFDICTQTPFLWNSKSQQLIVYDDVQSAVAKATFAQQQQLKGVHISTSNGYTEEAYKGIADTLGSRGGKTTSPPVVPSNGVPVLGMLGNLMSV